LPVTNHFYFNTEALSSQDTKRWRRARKLQAVVNTLKKEEWSFAQFLSAWVEPDEGEGIILKHRRYVRIEQRREALLDAVAKNPQLSGMLGTPVESFTLELDRLIQEPYFATFDRILKLEDIDFDIAFRTMQDIAPIWHTTLLRMLSNQRAHRASYGSVKTIPGEQDVLVKRAYAITSMICCSRAKKQSNFFTSLVDIYLVGSGVKRRVFETLSGFGVCHSYKQANRIMSTIAEDVEVYPLYVNTLCELLGQSNQLLSTSTNS
jgi:hypothetical protein